MSYLTFFRFATLLVLSLFSTSIFAQSSRINLPINWSSPNIDYSVVDFGGNQSSLDNDPTNASNRVLKVIKTSTAQGWAGTTLSTEAGFATNIPFQAGASFIRARIYSPNVNMQIRMKAEDASDATRSVETPNSTTVANGWQTLTFNFANQAPGTAAINYSHNYNKLSVFFNFGIDGPTAGEKIFYIDDIEFGEGTTSGKLKIDLPITWDDSANVDYTTTDFGGNESELANDPLDQSNLVLKLTRTAQSVIFAGTVLGTEFGLRNPMPLTAVNRFITCKVLSPVAGITVRLKVENINGGINAETDQIVTVANQWQSLTFDFANHAAGTPAINYNNVHNKLVIFFNFGVLGSDIGQRIFYLDDVVFGTTTDLAQPKSQSSLQVFPNPCASNLNVKGLDASAKVVSLVNALGQTVIAKNTASGLEELTLDTGKLPSGIYRLSVAGTGNTVVKTVVVE